MARKATSGHVEKRDASIRIRFTFNDVAYCETVRLNGVTLKPTAANVKYAQRMSATIHAEIAAGSFNFAEHFPESPRAKLFAPDADAKNTFGALADLWLDSKGQLEAATLDQYGTAVRFWKEMFGAGTPVAELTDKVVKAKTGKYKWPSPKAHNNYMIALRGIFGLEYGGKRSFENPTVGITNLKVVKKLPDPFTIDERDRILADMRQRYDVRVYAYFAWMFYTGMRPEEAIALRWADIDFNTAVCRVQRVRTFKGTERDGSKTHAERDVDLVPGALEALALLKPYTFMKRDADGVEVDIFENPVTGRAWHDERSQRDHYWKPCLKRLGVRWRRPYNTRHTYCTIALMGTVKPAYIAAQAGHSVKMLLDKYARWIPANDDGTERIRLAAAQAGAAPMKAADFSPQFPRAVNDEAKSLIHKGEIGRRDWTRTNDPHHVKVVL